MNPSIQWKKVLFLNPDTRSEFITGLSIWGSIGLFISACLIYYFLNVLSPGLVITALIICPFAGFAGAWTTWWWMGKLGLRR